MKYLHRSISGTARQLAVGLVVVLAAGCGGGSSDDEGADAYPVRPPDPSEYWTTEVVADGNVGMFVKMDITPAGTPAVVYYDTWGESDGLCVELDTDPPTRVLWDLHYAERSSAENWAVELVSRVLIVGLPPGLDFAIAPDGTPTISTVTGEPVVPVRYCGANDVGYYRRTAPGSWSVTVAVANSGEAVTGQPASDYGYVVGFWPGLAFDGSGNPAIAYRDVHAGGMQSDDNIRSDLELAWQSGGWQAIPVDVGQGAGEYNEMIFDADDRPLIVYTNQVAESSGGDQGIHVTRSADEGASWEKVELFPGASLNGPDVTMGPDGDVHVAYYHPIQGIPYLASLTDDEAFTSAGDGWTQSPLGDPRYDEGYDPSVAVDPEGRVAMAYYRCTPTANGVGNCDAQGDGLIFAFQEYGDWTYELVDPGEDYGQCGRYASLAFDGDGNAVIAYNCQVMVDGSVEDQVRYAYREPF